MHICRNNEYKECIGFFLLLCFDDTEAATILCVFVLRDILCVLHVQLLFLPITAIDGILKAYLYTLVRNAKQLL